MSQRYSQIVSPYLRREMQINRLRDLLIFVPSLPAVIFLSPLVDAIDKDVSILGIPAQYWWIFSVWFVSLLVLRLVGRAMLRRTQERE